MEAAARKVADREQAGEEGGDGTDGDEDNEEDEDSEEGEEDEPIPEVSNEIEIEFELFLW